MTLFLETVGGKKRFLTVNFLGTVVGTSFNIKTMMIITMNMRYQKLKISV